MENGFPIVNEKNINDRLGSAIFESKIASDLLLIPHSGNKDFGIDYTAEIIDKKNSSVSGAFLNIQLKSHNSIHFNKKGNYGQQVRITTLRYWLSLDIPILVVLVDISTHKVYAIDGKKYIREHATDIDFSRNKATLFISKNDLFSNLLCRQSLIDEYKYSLLANSALDSFAIRKFISYIASSYGRDFFLPVDDYSDLTREILVAAEKYLVFDDKSKTLSGYYNRMLDAIKDCLINGSLDYDNYYEKMRSEFGEAAIPFFKKLISLICDEIKNDKTNFLKKNLYRFIRLDKELTEHSSPINDYYWIEADSNNNVNCDYDYQDTDN